MTFAGDDIQCVVVHHASPTTVSATVEALIDCGVPPRRILVVDNSPPEQADLVLAEGVRTRRVSNRGYAAAANLGVAHFQEDGPARFTLVCSHEALIDPGSLEALAVALDADSAAAVAGPTLLVDPDVVWSTGGYLTPRLHLPRHHRERGATEDVVDREWLDGAVTLYRTSALAEFPFDETYFLYFEETDLHLRLRRAGLRVLWVPRAVADQTSSGIPARLLGRNLRLFLTRHFSRADACAAVAFEAVRSLVRKAATGRGSWSSWREIAAGWREGGRVLASTRNGGA